MKRVITIIALMNLIFGFLNSMSADNLQTPLERDVTQLRHLQFGAHVVCWSSEITDTIDSRGEYETFLRKMLSDETCTALQPDHSSYDVQLLTFGEFNQLKHNARQEMVFEDLNSLPDSAVFGMKVIKSIWQYKGKEYISWGVATDKESILFETVATYIVWPKCPYKPFPWWYVAMGVTIAAIGIIWLIVRFSNRKYSALYKKLQEVNMANVDMNLDKFRTQIYPREYYTKIQRIIELYKKACYYEEHFDAIDMAQLQQDINQHLNKYLVRLKWLYPNLTAIDIDMCSLYILGLSRTDISIVMEHDRSTIYRREKKLLRDVFPNAQTLNTALDELRNKK